MNTARKLETKHYPPFRRRGDRARALSTAIQQVEKEHANRLRRMVLMLGGATALLLVNGVIVTQFI